MYSNLFKVPLLFSRHAETPNNINPFHHMNDPSHTAVTPLTPKGKAQMKAHADWYVAYAENQQWQLVTAILSPYDRTQALGNQTIDALCGSLPNLSIRVITDDLMREHDSGFYRGRRELSNPRWEELRKKANEDEVYHFFKNPGGESLADSLHRQELLLMKYGMLFEKTGGDLGDAVLMFGHGLTGRLLFKLLKDESWKWFWEQKTQPNGSVRLFDKGQDHGYIFIPPKAESTEAA